MVSDSDTESSYNPEDGVVIDSDCDFSECTVVVLFSGSVGDVSDIAEDFVSDLDRDVSDSAAGVVVSNSASASDNVGGAVVSISDIVSSDNAGGVFVIASKGSVTGSK
jgi:hypothetical protein